MEKEDSQVVDAIWRGIVQELKPTLASRGVDASMQLPVGTIEALDIIYRLAGLTASADVIERILVWAINQIDTEDWAHRLKAAMDEKEARCES